MPIFPVYGPITGRMQEKLTAVRGWLQYSPHGRCWAPNKIFLMYQTWTGE